MNIVAVLLLAGFLSGSAPAPQITDASGGVQSAPLVSSSHLDLVFTAAGMLSTVSALQGDDPEDLVRKLRRRSYFYVPKNFVSDGHLLRYVEEHEVEIRSLVEQVEYGRNIERFLPPTETNALSSEPSFFRSVAEADGLLLTLLEQITGALASSGESLALNFTHQSLNVLGKILSGIKVYLNFRDVTTARPTRILIDEYIDLRSGGNDPPHGGMEPSAAWSEVTKSEMYLEQISNARNIPRERMDDWLESVYLAYRLVGFRDSGELRRQKGKAIGRLAAEAASLRPASPGVIGLVRFKDGNRLDRVTLGRDPTVYNFLPLVGFNDGYRSLVAPRGAEGRSVAEAIKKLLESVEVLWVYTSDGLLGRFKPSGIGETARGSQWQPTLVGEITWIAVPETHKTKYVSEIVFDVRVASWRSEASFQRATISLTPEQKKGLDALVREFLSTAPDMIRKQRPEAGPRGALNRPEAGPAIDVFDIEQDDEPEALVRLTTSAPFCDWVSAYLLTDWEAGRWEQLRRSLYIGECERGGPVLHGSSLKARPINLDNDDVAELLIQEARWESKRMGVYEVEGDDLVPLLQVNDAYGA